VDGGSPAVGAREEPQPDWRSEVIDVSEMALSDLTAGDSDSVLARSLRRLADDLDHPGEPIAGFNSAL
jgi:FXSXX-COOH protein